MATIITIGNAQHSVSETKEEIDNIILNDPGSPVIMLNEVVRISSVATTGGVKRRKETEETTYIRANIIKYS